VFSFEWNVPLEDVLGVLLEPLLVVVVDVVVAVAA
jgi:hypothetical protein